MAPRDTGQPLPRLRQRLVRWLPVLGIGAMLALALVTALDLRALLTLDTLRAHREDLLGFVAARPVLAHVAFVASYALCAAFAIPGSAVLCTIGGFLLGAPATIAAVMLAAAAGGSGTYIVARWVLAEAFRARAGPWLSMLRDGFHRNAFGYVVMMRVVPLFPFFVASVVPALLGVRWPTYVVGTAIGVVPFACVFSLAGAGLAEVLDAGGPLTVSSVMTPGVVAALCGLGMLAVLPGLWRGWRRRREAARRHQ